MAAGKQKLVPFLMVHYQPAVTDSYNSVSIAGWPTTGVDVFVVIVLECIGNPI